MSIAGNAILPRFIPASKKPRNGFVPAGAYSVYASPTGNPYDAFHSVYSGTLFTRTLPPISTGPEGPTATLVSFSFAGVQGLTSAQPTWTWAYGGGAATSYSWTVFGDASATPTTVLVSGTTSITSYVYTGATVSNFYYKITVSATNATATASFSDTQRNVPLNIVATGGTITTVGGVKYHRFTSGGNFVITTNTSRVPIDIFAIGGGGGGGVVSGGGGGSGIAVRAQLIFDPGAASQLGTYAVVIGAGGSGAAIDNGPVVGPFASQGASTTITNPSSQVITCQGGGVGATNDYLSDGTNLQFATAGGGGSGYYTDATVGFTGTPTMGFPLAANITYYSSGLTGGSGCDFLDPSNNPSGGGGAGVGGNGTSVASGTANGGNGGPGVTIGGVVYGGGGGGAGGAVGFSGGTGIGGLGGGAGGGGGNGATWTGTQEISGGNAPANSGGGGGGGIWNNGGIATGGNGGSGIAIFYYPVY